MIILFLLPNFVDMWNIMDGSADDENTEVLFSLSK